MLLIQCLGTLQQGIPMLSISTVALSTLNLLCPCVPGALISLPGSLESK